MPEHRMSQPRRSSWRHSKTRGADQPARRPDRARVGAHSSGGEPDAGYQEPPDLEPPAGYVPPPARRDDPTPHVEDAAVPAFLAGRAAAQPASTALPPPRSSDHVTAEELVPSWEIDGRYGAEALEDGGGGNRIDSILTAIAVIAIPALGVAGVLFLPGLLAGGPGPSRTPPPSILAPSTLPSSGPSSAPSTAPQTTQPTSAPATANANPGASPRFYRIRVGDTLAKIARRFGITVEERSRRTRRSPTRTRSSSAR